MVNIPHREYWLHPDRHATTMAFVQTIMNWIAVIFSFFMIAINHLVFKANLGGGRLDAVWFGAIMTVFLVTIFALIGILLYHFRLPRGLKPSR